ncbi:ATP-dependent nuclease [Paraburkholderia heleia]|uniref:ATP-dependent nuclease n=1 Tax=Paraburkholderia heleia TaxID=634127 RepID=UPI000A04D47B|nr:ATP-binding protein [Paraburkholderia heleia]
MEIYIQIEHVQHIVSACIAVPFDGHQLFCIVGRNGVGKTSIVKAIRNLRVSDTYKITSDESIFSERSRIVYKYGAREFEYTYDPNIHGLNSRSIVPRTLREEIEVELPMPFGERFNYFRTIWRNDAEIRQNVVLENYSKPEELIELLSHIYGSDRFDSLREININGRQYYCIILEGSRYIREDYFSSGEYFVISLYRKIKNKKRLIVIDEIDISLDAAAQVHLISKLRDFCKKYKVNIVFTTHSLAMMQMLNPEELLYVENSDGNMEHRNASYNYVKSRLFGFSGWDRYILTEDLMLKNFLNHIIDKYIKNVFFKYRVINVGAASNTVDLMRRDAKEHYFSETGKVIVVLDGDQKNEPFVKNLGNILFLPFASVEKEIFSDYSKGKLKKLPSWWKGDISKLDGKGLCDALRKAKLYSNHQLFDYLCEKYRSDIGRLVSNIDKFLNINSSEEESLELSDENYDNFQAPPNTSIFRQTWDYVCSSLRKLVNALKVRSSR